jgi:hypothetical protein
MESVLPFIKQFQNGLKNIQNGVYLLCACLKTHTTQGMAPNKKAIPILKKRLCIVAE